MAKDINDGEFKKVGDEIIKVLEKHELHRSTAVGVLDHVKVYLYKDVFNGDLNGN